MKETGGFRFLRQAFLLAALLLVAMPLAGAQVPAADTYSFILTNSEDWTEVYSAEIFGSLLGKTVKFLVSPRHTQLILYELSKESDILVLSSEDLPFAVGYESMLQSQGFSADERFFGRGELNLALARALPDAVRSFIVIDPSYGYNAISVAPYAVRSGSYVLFADDTNAGDVADFLSDRGVGRLILYGSLDREVRDALAQFNPETINFEGDRYKNNIEMVRRYLALNPTRQVLLSNGEFIEQEIVSGSQAVLFIGTGNVPDDVKAFIKEQDIEVGVLIGNQYVGTATSIRRQTGVSVFVKFARGARNPSGPISQVEGLDLFYLPSYSPRISIFSIVYNQMTNRLEVTIKNEETFATYFKGTYTITTSDNQRQRIGDIEPIFLDGNKFKTITYDIGQASGDLIADAFVLFGESPASMDFLLEQKGIRVETTSILDNAQVQVEEAFYDAVHDRFVVTLFNPGDVAAYADVEIFDVRIAGEMTILTTDSVVMIEPGERARAYLPAVLQESDYDDNRKINVRVFYGQREEYLIKTLIAKFDLVVKTTDYLTIALVVLVVALVALFLFLIARRRKRREQGQRWTSRWSGSTLRKGFT